MEQPLSKEDARIKQLMKDVGYPDSLSLYQAFKQIVKETKLAQDVLSRRFALEQAYAVAQHHERQAGGESYPIATNIAHLLNGKQLPEEMKEDMLRAFDNFHLFASAALPENTSLSYSWSWP